MKTAISMPDELSGAAEFEQFPLDPDLTLQLPAKRQAYVDSAFSSADGVDGSLGSLRPVGKSIGTRF